MMTRPRLAIGSAAAVLLGVLLPLPASAGPPTSRPVTMATEKVDGVFRAWFGDCPDDVPAAPLVCTEWDLFVYRVGTHETSGGIAPPHQSWRMDALHHTLTFPGGFGEPEESDAVRGFGEVEATFDQQHLTGATLHVEDFALDDGSTVDVEAVFTAYGARIQSGNDGEGLNGRPRHERSDCANVIRHAHQKFRLATATAVIDGVGYRYDGRFGFVAYNLFKDIEVHPASCT